MNTILAGILLATTPLLGLAVWLTIDYPHTERRPMLAAGVLPLWSSALIILILEL